MFQEDAIEKVGNMQLVNIFFDIHFMKKKNNYVCKNLDFPMTYHAKKQFSDLVRRRRWYRKCRLNTRGPWQEVGQSRIIDVSLQSFRNNDLIVVWGISSAGDALFRRGVSIQTPSGSSWEHIPCDVPLVSVSCSTENNVWAVAKNGGIFFRQGTTFENPIGSSWKRIDAPSNMQFKQVSAGEIGVWALDTQSRLSVRREISASNPEGKYLVKYGRKINHLMDLFA